MLTLMATVFLIASITPIVVVAAQPVSDSAAAIIPPPALNPDAALSIVEACRALAKQIN